MVNGPFFEGNFFNQRRDSGFTLVELLIVVAIIGILSTVGIPTFKRMVQKAKKSEAKVALGGLYTAEAAFFSEYGVYGSFLEKIGYEVSGGAGQVYTIGFTSATCSDLTMMPLETNAAGTALKNVFGGYYPATVPTSFSVLKAIGARVPTACQLATRTDDGTDFVATATGAINPGGSLSTLTGSGSLDTWTINKSRTLSNVNDGVN